ncbi:uncharacterized protein LOC110882195 [Helianthus annuus]|uniref:uncharacterized protein LOC110882195 n=1 Tax=Helianthus annuus TaxID=4232 RepID=UPI000B8EEE33|nr:uncharacterized protein LOC110882195 [Helianthus annuus]
MVQKCNIFAWRSEINRIPTGVALRNRNIPIVDVSCPLCNSGDETVDHLFTACVVASTVWQFVSSWCIIPSIFAFSFKDLLEIHSLSGLSDQRKDVIQGIIIIRYWSIWKARNELKFAGKTARIENIVSEIKALGFL